MREENKDGQEHQAIETANKPRREKEESGRRGRSEGAQTFRRGRALHFLERLELRRSTLAGQLEESAFESIRPVIAGELKAVDGIIREFVQVFELHGKPEGCEPGEGRHRGHGKGRRGGGRKNESGAELPAGERTLSLDKE
ncbi:hypothetical protein [Saccharibacillus deserti]|uniref:hypothetical protein n=1 Tax=Saccharibacillus deserti TaxID=1634444 RepID=UPI0015E6AEA2|nr:hypothetical protein [Saccharibacillus deserti]